MFTLQQSGHKQWRWGHNFHGNDFAAPHQAGVGRHWLCAAWFLLPSLILKLSLTQQIPPSVLPHSPRCSSPLSSLIRLSSLFFFFQAPSALPHRSAAIHPSVCRNAAWWETYRCNKFLHLFQSMLFWLKLASRFKINNEKGLECNKKCKHM